VEGEPKFGASMMEKDKKMLLEKANNDIVLSLGDRVLRRRLHRNYGLSLRACRWQSPCELSVFEVSVVFI